MEVGLQRGRFGARLVSQEAVSHDGCGVEDDFQPGIGGDQLRLAGEHLPQGPADLVGIGRRMNRCAARSGETGQLGIGLLGLFVLAQVDHVENNPPFGGFSQPLLDPIGRTAVQFRQPVGQQHNAVGPLVGPGGVSGDRVGLTQSRTHVS